MRHSPTACLFFLVACCPLMAQNVPMRLHTLPNGLRVLLLPRQGDPNIAAGWVAKVGSVNERPGITGTAHLFEHMMFKGTRVIGTNDIDKGLAVMAKLDAVKGKLAHEEKELRRRQRHGEIEDASDPAERSEKHRQLLERFQQLLASQRELIVKGEFDRIYTAAGASGMNAGTTNDFTIYFINVPKNKLELWFWMESDRLLNPVFREFYSERDVVREERRLRVESTPTGKFAEQFDALFWGSSPYSWPVIGWPSDVEAVTRDEALSFYDVYYAPGNLSVCLVGDFDADEAVKLAGRYFGRLEQGPHPPPDVRTVEIPQVAEKRMIAHAETKPRVILRYHTVPRGHRDAPALLVLEEVLNGRTGRLYKSLVLGQEIATSARSGQRGMKYEGYFELRGVVKPPHTPNEVEKALSDLVAGLAAEDVEERELQKVKNRLAAREFRKLRSSFSLMFELLVREAYGTWETINSEPPRLQAVTAKEIREAVGKYFRTENRAVLVYHTKDAGGGAAAEEDPLSGDAEKSKGGDRK
ncbi:MAG: pitrilysin family protein [Planctomycetota bacterium]|nr:pitrilysin family protein [Planctomycetota bacterium]